MATDDERRRVAAALRGLTSNVYGLRKSYESEGFSILCEEQADYYQMCKAVCGYLPPEHMHPCDYKELHDCLADLIDPDCEEGRYEGVHTTRPVDREALLALAEEMQGYADGAASGDGFPYVNAGSLWSYADRIREVCGEVVR